MSRRARARKRESGGRGAREAAPVRRRSGLWQAGNSAVSRVLGEMESAFGEDFSGVQVDSSPRARQAAQAMNATAVTHDETIFLGPHAPAFESEAGRRLLAHELAHVVQQRRAPSLDSSTIEPPGGAFESAADHAAAHAVHGQVPPVAGAGAAPAVQRQQAKPDENFDVKQAIQDLHDKFFGPAPRQTPEEGKKIPKVDPDSGLPSWARSIKKWLMSGKEDKRPKTGGPDQQKPAGQRDAGKEADTQAGTVLFPQVPIHEAINRAQKPKPKARPAPAKSTAEVPQPPVAAATGPKIAGLEDKVFSSLAEAQRQKREFAELHLDAPSAADREALLTQVEAAIQSVGERFPLVRRVFVYFGGETAKVVTLGAKQ